MFTGEGFPSKPGQVQIAKEHPTPACQYLCNDEAGFQIADAGDPDSGVNCQQE